MKNENDNSRNRVLAITQKQSFQSETARIQAKALLSEITEEIPDYNWAYNIHRITRNAILASYELEKVSRNNPDYADHNISEAAKKLAMLWESLAQLDESYKKETNLLNAAINYDLAGYQANAICLAKKIDDHTPSETGLELLTSLFIQRKFLSLLKESQKFLNEPEIENGFKFDVIMAMALAFCSKGFKNVTEFFFQGHLNSLEAAYNSFEKAEDIFTYLSQAEESNLVSSIRSLIPVMESRSTWNLLKNYAPNDPKWNLYIKLLARGIGEDVLNRNSISELWISQINALENGLLSTDINKIIKMPTSAGKTRIAELAIVHTLIKDPNAKCVYVAPYRALVSELKQSFLSVFNDLGYRVSSVSGSYESDDFEELLFKKTDILILTPEKLDLLFRAKPEFLDNLKLVILDEIHIIDDDSRGIKFELLMTRIKRKLSNTRFITLSAVVPHETLEDLAKWFNVSPKKDIITSSWRPSIQRYAKFNWSGNIGVINYEAEKGSLIKKFVPGVLNQHYLNENLKKFPAKDKKNQIAAELAIKFAERGPTLVFTPHRNNVESITKCLKEIIKSSKNSNFNLNKNKKTHSIILAEEWLGSEHLVTKSLKMGIAMHHGGIPQIVGDAILNDFRQKKYRFIVANNTLSQGVNLPIRTVIIHSCYRYNEKNGKRERISAREYWNIAGRAGRATEETEGLIIHINLKDYDERDIDYFLEHMENVEPVESALYKSLIQLIRGRLSENALKEELNSEILALLVEEENLSDEMIREILNDSVSQIQAKRNNIPFKKLRKIALDVVEEIKEEIQDPKIRALYSSTGLRTQSCRIIHSHIMENRTDLIRIFNDEFKDIDSLISLFLSICIQIPELKPKKFIEIDQESLLKSWIIGDEINYIYKNLDSETSIDDLTSLIGDYFSYKLPWGISSYLNIAYGVLGINKSLLPEYIKFFPSMVKFGVPNPVACWAMSIGITSRKIAINFAERYISETESQNYEDFLEWINQISSDILSHDYNLESPMIEDVSTSIFNSGYNDLLSDFEGMRRLLPILVEVKGIKYGDRQKNLQLAKIGDDVELIRDYDNKIDKNSILVRLFTHEIGYIPRKVAQLLAIELDIGTTFNSTIIDFDEYSGVPIIVIDIPNENED